MCTLQYVRGNVLTSAITFKCMKEKGDGQTKGWIDAHVIKQAQ